MTVTVTVTRSFTNHEPWPLARVTRRDGGCHHCHGASVCDSTYYCVSLCHHCQTQQPESLAWPVPVDSDRGHIIMITVTHMAAASEWCEDSLAGLCRHFGRTRKNRNPTVTVGLH